MASRKQYEMDFMLNARMNGGFSGTVTKAQKEFARLGTEIQALNKVQGNISNYQKQQKAVENTTRKLQNLQRQHDLLQREISETTGDTTALEREKARLEQQIDSTNNALQNQQQRLDATGQALTEAGVDTSHLAEESDRLTREIQELSEEQEEAGRHSATMGERFGQAFESMGAAIDALNLTEFVSMVKEAVLACVDLAGELEATMSNVQAISGSSSEQMADLTDKAMQMGATTKFTAVEAGDAFSYMAMAGWKAGDMINGIEGIMNLAAASGEDLATTSDIVTDALTAFGLTAADSGHFADILAVASSNANTNVGLMGETFKYAAPMFGAMGYSAEDAAIAIGMMANSGIKASNAGTALRTGLTNLAKPTEQMQAAMDKYGISLTDASGEMLPFRDLIDQLREKLGGLPEVEQTAAAGAIFGKNAMSGWLAVINGADADLDKLTAAVDNCTGAAQEMAEIQLDNLKGDITLLSSAFDGLKITIGNEFLPIGRKLVQWATDVVSWMDNFVQEEPAMSGALMGAAGGLTALTAAVTAVNGAIKVFKGLKAAGLFAGLGGPIMLAVTAAGALGGAIWSAYEAWESAVPSVKDLTTAVQENGENMEEAKSAYEDAALQYESTANVADTYINKIEQMGESTEEGAEHSDEYMQTLGLLVDLIPDLSNVVDTETGAIEGGTEALRANTDAWKENAKEQAKQKYIEESYSGYNSIMQEVTGNEIKLIKARTEHEAKTRELYNAEQRLTNMEEEAKRTGEDLGEGYERQRSAVSELKREISNSEREQNNLSEAIEEGKAALEEQETVIREDLDAWDEYESMQEGASGSTAETAAQTDELSGALQSTVDSVLALQEAYQDAYGEALESVQGQYDLWTQVDDTVATSSADIISAINSQSEYWSTYNDNLSRLRERSGEIEGLDAVIQQLSDGSTESANAAAGLANASDTELQRVVEAWTNLQTEQGGAAEEMAINNSGILTDLNSTVASMGQTISKMDYSSESVAAARSTMESYLQKIQSYEGPVYRAASSVAQKAISALNAKVQASGGGSSGGSTPHLASGTEYARAGLTLVGEEGPELMMMRGGEKVIPADETAQLLSPEPGNTYSIEYAPRYSVTGTDPAGLRAVLEEHDRNMPREIERVIANIERRRERVAYR